MKLTKVNLILYYFLVFMLFNHAPSAQSNDYSEYFYCNLMFGLEPTPLMTPEFLNRCYQGDFGFNDDIGTFAEQVNHFSHSFFVPYDPQWIQTISFVNVLYGEEPRRFHWNRIDVSQENDLIKNRSVKLHHFIIHHNRQSNIYLNHRSGITTSFIVVQVIPFSLEQYAVIEVLRLGGEIMRDVKRLILIKAVAGGSLVSHFVTVQLDPHLADAIKRPLLLVEKQLHQEQTSRLKSQIYREMSVMKDHF